MSNTKEIRHDDGTLLGTVTDSIALTRPKVGPRFEVNAVRDEEYDGYWVDIEIDWEPGNDAGGTFTAKFDTKEQAEVFLDAMAMFKENQR